MVARRNGRSYECIVVDLNTQQDFCAVDGANPVANVGELIPALRRAVAWAKRNHAPVISSIESHRRCEFLDGASQDFCVDGSRGQQKIKFTVFPRSAQVEVDNSLACPIDLFRQHQQVIFRKRSDDLLANPKADRFFTQIPVNEFIIVGVGVEDSIKQLALGLLARGKRVTVVTDASGYWNKGMADLALKKMIAKGASVITTEQLSRRKLVRERRYPGIRSALARAARFARGNGRPAKRDSA